MLDKHLLKGDILEALLRSPPAESDLRIMLDVAFAADIAEILEDLSGKERVLVLRCLSPEKAADVIEFAPDRLQKSILTTLLTQSEIAGILNEIAPDEGADLLEMLPDETGERALESVEPAQAQAIRSLATYDPETAGGRMTTEFVTVSPDLTIGEALELLRQSLDLESVSNVYVLDGDDRLVGVLSMRDILEAEPAALVRDEMIRDVVSALVEDDQEDASRLLDRYDFASLPVVDDEHRLRGVITVDDAMEVLEEEAEEDIALIAGSGVVTARDSVLRHLKFRLPWLFVTLAGGMLAVFLARQFKGSLREVPELSYFMPVILGMAGNVGIQSSTVMVRGFATGEMILGMATRTVMRQIVVGLVVGVICGVATGIVAAIFTGMITMGYAVAISLALGITAAAFAGTVLPIACERLNIDPAVASGPVITTMNDLLGLLIYFAVATFLLVQTT